MAPYKGNAPMPACNKRDQTRIVDTIRTFRGANRRGAEGFLDELGPKALCRVLHSMRRWYTSHNGHQAVALLTHHEALKKAMTLTPPVGAVRGFKVSNDNPLSDVEEGDVIDLEVTRNSACSSWTLGDTLPNRFSGASRGKTGLIVELLRSRDEIDTFIAPPERSKQWFNHLYAKTMGTSYRDNEREFAICAPTVRVEVVRVKR